MTETLDEKLKRYAIEDLIERERYIKSLIRQLDDEMRLYSSHVRAFAKNYGENESTKGEIE